MDTVLESLVKQPEGTMVELYRTRVRRIVAAPRFLVVAILLSVVSCQTVPITGRMAFNRYSLDEDKALGAQAYDEMMSQEPLLSSGPEYDLVNRVMDRLVAASTDIDPGFEWEVSVIDNDQVVNAFALPGGKMAVYTGILPVAEGETGLAVVMGHEIGHAIARHGTQRVTSSGLVSGAVDLLLDGTGKAIADVFSNVLALGYGRSQELEADHIGLILMSKAAYDPREAEFFWQRMSALGGSDTIELLSTHPSDDTRIEQIRAKLPEAMALYEAATGQ